MRVSENPFFQSANQPSLYTAACSYQINKTSCNSTPPPVFSFSSQSGSEGSVLGRSECCQESDASVADSGDSTEASFSCSYPKPSKC